MTFSDIALWNRFVTKIEAKRKTENRNKFGQHLMKASLTMELLYLIVLLLAATAGGKVPRCEVITMPMCQAIGYNKTKFPNVLNHESQEEAGLEVHQFWPLVEVKCSQDLRFFLCSVYSPICTENSLTPIPACRSVCERAKQGCMPILQQYGYQWPESLSCERLPVFGDAQKLCMENPSKINSSDIQNKSSVSRRRHKRPTTTTPQSINNFRE